MAARVAAAAAAAARWRGCPRGGAAAQASQAHAHWPTTKVHDARRRSVMTSEGGEVMSLMPVIGMAWIVVFRATRSMV